MKLIIIIIVILLILGIILYTQDTLDVLSIFGKHSLNFGKNVYSDIKEKSEEGDFQDIYEDVKEKYGKID